MKLEKTKNTKRNVLWGLLNKLVMMLLPFMIRTIIIRELGSEYLGLNSLFSSILQVLNLSELGFSSAVVYSMYKPIAEGNHKSICALLNFYRKVYIFIGCLILGVGLIILPFIPYLISGYVPNSVNIYILFLIYLINTTISYFLFAYKTSLLNAHQRQDILSNTLTITQGGMYACQILILMVTKNYYIYLVSMPVFTVLNNLINAVKIKHLYPEYIAVGKIADNELKTIKRQVPGLMINRLCYISRNSLDSIFISAYLGLTVSAMYGNYYYIMNSIFAIMAIFSNSIIAGVGNSQVTESRERNYITMKKINFIYMWIGGWCTICLVCLFQPFMKVWVGEELMFNFSTMILFCIYFYVLQMGTIRGVYSDAAGLWWENRYRAIIESVANLVLNFVLVQLFGINGIIIATLISLFAINFLWGSRIVFQYYFKNGKDLQYFTDHAIYAIVTSIIALITLWLCNLVTLSGISGLAIYGFICTIVPNVLYILIYFRTKDYRLSIPWLLNVVGLSKIFYFLIPKNIDE